MEDSSAGSEPSLEDACSALAQVSFSLGDTPAATLYAVARIVTDVLGVDRFSVWCAAEDQTAIRQYFLYCKRTDAVSDGVILRKRDFPAYFSCLGARVLAVEDVSRDPAAADLLEPYLRPLSIGALLDAPLYVAGVVGGIVCQEHVGGPRTWTAEERLFVATVADNVSRLLEVVQRQRAEQNVRVYREQLASLNQMERMVRVTAEVAHDFRNVLAVVTANIDLLDTAALSAPDRDAIRDIRDVVRRGSVMSSELLTFGRDRERHPAVLSVRSNVSAILRSAAPSLGQCQVVMKMESDVSPIFLDATDLERVLLNLLFNARDAMEGSGTIEVSISQAAGDQRSSALGHAVTISVSDTGPGMDADTRMRVFEPFYTRKPTGTGLGLSIAQQIVTQAGGAIEIESVLGQGTTMRVALPAIG